MGLVCMHMASIFDTSPSAVHTCVEDIAIGVLAVNEKANPPGLRFSRPLAC